MSTTSDRNDPDVGKPAGNGTGLNRKYLVLSEAERAKGFVEPVRTKYLHLTCNVITTMSLPIAETYARDPSFYGGTYCCSCRGHFPVGAEGEFVWVERGEVTDLKVGTATALEGEKS